MKITSSLIALGLWGIVLAAPPLRAESPPAPNLSKKDSSRENRENKDFTKLSLEELLNEEITSASKYPQKPLTAPSAVTVITSEDIERSGALDLPELFRFVSGTLVVKNSRAGFAKYEVSMRGYPQSSSPRLLVLLDGIPIYELSSSGVLWPFIPFSLRSIDRIEIIRGASSTLYGANAFSGVINIVSKKIQSKPAVTFFGSGGNFKTTEEEVVWDQPLSDQARFRLSGLFLSDAGSGIKQGQSQFDRQRGGQGKFDLEADLSDATRFRFYFYDKALKFEEVSGLSQLPSRSVMNNLLTGIRLEHQFNDRQNLSFQGNYSHFQQYSNGITIPILDEKSSIQNVSFELQYLHRLGESNTLVTGANFRNSRRSLSSNLTGQLDRDQLSLASLFVNNDYKIKPNLILTTGGRYEFDTFTHHQFSGRLNLTYLPVETQALRFSAARAVRTPSGSEERTRILNLPNAAPPPLPPDTLTDVLGNPNLKPESVLAFEFGYKGRFLNSRLQADVQFYFNDLRDFILFGPAGFDPFVVPPKLTVSASNVGHGQVYGVESELVYQPFDWWRASVNHTFTRQTKFETGRFPAHLVNFKNRFAFRNGFSAEILLNWTDSYRYFSSASLPIPSFVRLDARVAQKFWGRKLEVAVVGQNLTGTHAESPSFTGVNNRVERRIYGTLQYNFGGEKK